jgi:hypothetical protein
MSARLRNELIVDGVAMTRCRHETKHERRDVAAAPDQARDPGNPSDGCEGGPTSVLRRRGPGEDSTGRCGAARQIRHTPQGYPRARGLSDSVHARERDYATLRNAVTRSWCVEMMERRSTNGVARDDERRRIQARFDTLV